jgi:Uma2 family endonuclease
MARHGREADMLSNIVKVLLDYQGKEYESFIPITLVIEVDVTSYTDVADYWPYKIPEVWLLRQKRLMMMIYLLQGDRYELASSSRQFPTFDLPQLMETYYG